MDLIRLEGESNSVILRVADTQNVAVLSGVTPEVMGKSLTCELLVDSTFVRGSMPLWLFRADLEAWRDVLDALDGGDDALWLTDGRGPEIALTRDDQLDRLHFTVKDWVSSNTTVSLAVPITDAWFDDAYERLDQVWTTWPLTP